MIDGTLGGAAAMPIPSSGLAPRFSAIRPDEPGIALRGAGAAGPRLRRLAAAATEHGIAADVEKRVQDFLRTDGSARMETVDLKLVDASTEDAVAPDYRATARLQIRLW